MSWFVKFDHVDLEIGKIINSPGQWEGTSQATKFRFCSLRDGHLRFVQLNRDPLMAPEIYKRIKAIHVFIYSIIH